MKQIFVVQSNLIRCDQRRVVVAVSDRQTMLWQTMDLQQLFTTVCLNSLNPCDDEHLVVINVKASMLTLQLLFCVTQRHRSCNLFCLVLEEQLAKQQINSWLKKSLLLVCFCDETFVNFHVHDAVKLQTSGFEQSSRLGAQHSRFDLRQLRSLMSETKSQDKGEQQHTGTGTPEVSHTSTLFVRVANWQRPSADDV